MAEENLFMQIMGWAGTALALFFFISPITLMWKLIKKQIDINIIPWVMLLANTGNTVLWTAYGYAQEGKTQVWVCNGIGTVINTLYTINYFIHLFERKLVHSIAVTILILGVVTGILIVFEEFVDPDVTGIIAMVINIIMYAAPGQKILDMFKKVDYNILPIHITFIGIACSTCWLLYGILNEQDWHIIVPNALGLFFSAVTIVCWVIVYNKRKAMGTDAEAPTATGGKDKDSDSYHKMADEKI